MRNCLSLLLDIIDGDIYTVKETIERAGPRELVEFKTFLLSRDLGGVVYSKLSAISAVELLPKAVSKPLMVSYLKSWRRAESMFRHMQALALLAKECGIEIIFLKGVTLSSQIYKDIGSRYVTDIDILIHEEDLDTLDRLLKKHGFRKMTIVFPSKKFVIKYALNHFQYEKDGIIYEIHWVFQNLPFINIDRNQLWSLSKDVCIENAVFKCLDLQHELLGLTMNIFADIQFFQSPQLKHCVDIYMIVKGMGGCTDLLKNGTSLEASGADRIFMKVICGVLLFFDRISSFPELEKISKEKDYIDQHWISGSFGKRQFLDRFFGKTKAFSLYRKNYLLVIVWWCVTLPSRVIGSDLPALLLKLRNKSIAA